MPNIHIHETQMPDPPRSTVLLVTPATSPGCVPAPKACITMYQTPNWRLPSRNPSRSTMPFFDHHPSTSIPAK